ncbi:hypothetical protein CI610_00808 [invertebrate metagenome]|uniref:Uncharacterized protein n=1 Tax=invertebrate metagenome TaxID=1711999 RepID=A0A2H9TAA7_9ZZZZ
MHPDIRVDKLPHATFRGDDVALDAAIRYLQEKTTAQPQDIPLPLFYPKEESVNCPESAIPVGL